MDEKKERVSAVTSDREASTSGEDCERTSKLVVTEQHKRRILLRVAYDGTAYHGWQLQPRENTIEGELNKALCRLTGEDIKVIGASRTDAGVHALGNVAVFDTASRIPDEKFCYALNPYLPDDIIIQESRLMPMEFHPRRFPCKKTYEYQILNRHLPLPQYRNTAYFEHGSLDIEAMKRACSTFLGEHDFASFCAAGAQVESTVRTIYALEIEQLELSEDAGIEKRQKSGLGQETGKLLRILVQGNGFLYNMVRIIAGTLIEVGKGRIRPAEISEIIAACDRSKAGPTAPAHGLKLVEIRYGAIS